MQTLEEEFNGRVNAFLSRTGMGRTTLGIKAVGDANLLRQIERGRSPTLRTADRVLAYIASYQPDSGGAGAPPVRRRAPRPAPRPGKPRKSRAVRERGRAAGRKRPVRLLRIPAVMARTGLGRSTIYRWSAEGRFPAPVRLSARAVGWVESEVEAWLRERIEKSRAQVAANP